LGAKKKHLVAAQVNGYVRETSLVERHFFQPSQEVLALKSVLPSQ
jgi:hypothetical protein